MLSHIAARSTSVARMTVLLPLRTRTRRWQTSLIWPVTMATGRNAATRPSGGERFPGTRSTNPFAGQSSSLQWLIDTHVSMYQRLLMYEARLGRLPGDIVMPIHMDNTASLANATADNIHLGSRHLAIRIGVIRQEVRDLIIKPAYVNTTQNIADAMTKPMDKKHVLAFTPAMYGVRK